MGSGVNMLLTDYSGIILIKVPQFLKFASFFFHLEMKIPTSILSAFHEE